MANSMKFTLEVPRGIEDLLAKLPVEMRHVWLRKALTEASKIVIDEAKRLCPVGQGRVGKKAGKKHLRDTIGHVFREYKQGDLRAVYIGPQYPAGAHGHLVEFGHSNAFGGGRVEPKPFMRPAFDGKKGEAQQAIVAELKRGVESVKAAT